MSRRRKGMPQRHHLRYAPLIEDEHIPRDDRFVLKEQPGLPLERGGVYSEMGADMTYEELQSFPLTGKEFTHYEYHHEQQHAFSFIQIIGVILMFLGVFILFVSPFWFSVITLGMTLIAHHYNLKVTKYTALIFAFLGFIFALVSLLV